MVYNTIHNVAFYLDLMRGVRQSIALASFGAFREAFLSRLADGDAPGPEQTNGSI
jgi:queuine/archaeosine tRNA-ribosyltransferase